MHKSQVDETLRHGVLDLFDEPNGLVAVEKCAGHTPVPPSWSSGVKELFGVMAMP